MTRVPTRTHFFSSRLIRILSDLAILEAVEPGAGFSEKLGLWVDYSDAIALSNTLNAGTCRFWLSGRMAIRTLSNDFLTLSWRKRWLFLKRSSSKHKAAAGMLWPKQCLTIRRPQGICIVCS